MIGTCPICDGLLLYDQDTGNYYCGLCFNEFSERTLNKCEEPFVLKEEAWNQLL